MQQKIRAMGFNSEVMVAATSKIPLKRPKKYDIVFVGNRTAYGSGKRKVIENLGQIPYNLKVWGRGWQGVLPQKYYGGPYFDNQRLNELYAASLISLADHSETARQYGFVLIRVFDILASGGFCITDKNPGLKEIFGDSVPQYENAKHLRELIDFYLKYPRERQKLMQKGQKIALSHTWDSKAEQFIKAIDFRLSENCHSREGGNLKT